MGLILLRGTKNKTDRQKNHVRGFPLPVNAVAFAVNIQGCFQPVTLFPPPGGHLPFHSPATRPMHCLPVGSVEPEAFHERSLGHLAASQLCVCFL